MRHRSLDGGVDRQLEALGLGPKLLAHEDAHRPGPRVTGDPSLPLTTLLVAERGEEGPPYTSPDPGLGPVSVAAPGCDVAPELSGQVTPAAAVQPTLASGDSVADVKPGMATDLLVLGLSEV